MLIQVNYSDNSFDYVKDTQLSRLINSQSISKFRRTSGWVQIGVDPLRKSERSVLHDHSGNQRKIVRVEYHNNRYDYVRDTQLDRLIETSKVTRFLRKSGWVHVGIDPLRQKKRA
jgi:hypothetical protein